MYFFPQAISMHPRYAISLSSSYTGPTTYSHSRGKIQALIRSHSRNKRGKWCEGCSNSKQHYCMGSRSNSKVGWVS